MSARQKKLTAIIEKSTELFNEFGTSEISTNHIAEHLQISPGNLYYYFPNKEAIILAIFAEVREQIEALWQDKPETLFAQLHQYVNVVFKIIFGYRFLFADLSLIMRRDPVLRGEYIALQSRFKTELARLFLDLEVAGIFHSLTEEKNRLALANSVWIVSIYWHSYLETDPELTSQSPTERLLSHVLFLLKPYISAEFTEAIHGVFASYLQNFDQKL